MKIKEKAELNMTYGNPIKVILMFAIPILFGNLFQQLYNIVDTAIIGHVLGDQALAAVGATTAIYGLIIGFASGMTNGFSVVLARAYGAGKNVEIKKTVAMTVVLTVLVSTIITIVGLLGIRPLLIFLNTPETILEQSLSYLHVILAFTIVTMLYNMFAGLLRAIGNSRMPLLFLIVSTIVNIVLDILFVQGLHMGIEGAAYATVIAEIVSVVFCIVYIKKYCRLLWPEKEYLVWKKTLVSELFLTGLSMGLMIALASIGSVALQSSVNSLGEEIIAGHTTARKIHDILIMPLGTISVAASTFVSQNYGAGKNHRVYKGIEASILISFVWNVITCLIAWTGSLYLVRILTGSSDENVIQTAILYLKINVPFYFLLSILLVLRCSLQGIGKKILPLIVSGIELVLKFAAVGMITPTLGYMGVCIIEPLTWGICVVIVFVDFFLFVKQVRKKEFKEDVQMIEN
ncbi:MAG: MATE family efflux transporter [Lachnospiraceae bacterium]|nr:MATE family efflux transporter [Lachnospiraceae bacterium]MDD3615499.1 MATE family efflux transporter [Lachnospiraceae bacterium]